VQTLTVPYATSADGRVTIDRWSMHQSRAVRSAYANANGRSEKELRELLKQRFPNHPLGSWALHCATREGRRLLKQKPDGRMVFGGRANLERRRKGMINAEEWRRLRRRPIEIVGDRTYTGNRHFTLDADGLRCVADFLGEEVVLHLPELTGKQGRIMRAVAALAAAGEIAVQFSLDSKTLSVSFDELDLRKLAPGMTLETAKAADLAVLGKKPKGRKRIDPNIRVRTGHYNPILSVERPVHPEWRDAIPGLKHRAIGLDLNPEWIGISVVEVTPQADARNVDDVRVLHHRLHRITIPIAAPKEAVATVMAQIATMVVSTARAWNCTTIFHEDGLGKLAWSKKSRSGPRIQTVNYWSRNALLGGLARRCAVSGLTLSPIWGGYSTTIGNICFDLPDACAAAAEIARRGIAALRGEKDRLPAVPPRVLSRRWKDEEVPGAVAKATAEATCWQSVHRAIKAAKTLGYRRLHPPLAGPGILDHDGRGYAVNRLGCGKGHGHSASPVLTRTVRDSSDRVRAA
jgi:hypothetical protein